MPTSLSDMPFVIRSHLKLENWKLEILSEIASKKADVNFRTI